MGVQGIRPDVLAMFGIVILFVCIIFGGSPRTIPSTHHSRRRRRRPCDGFRRTRFAN